MIPYGIYRYNQIIQECYLISKNLHTSYEDVLNLTPKEKNTLLKLLNDDATKQKKQLDELKENNKH